MAQKKLFDLLYGALPVGYDPGQLRQYGKPELWESNERDALADALRELMDWRMYMTAYGDVEKTGMDPVLHFLRHGLFEGRKLFPKSSQVLCDENPEMPKVSVILVHKGNCAFLEKSISALLSQTMGEIEILAVNFAENGESSRIIKSMAQKDRRLKYMESGSTLHNAIQNCAGQYVMFMESSSFPLTRAFETACKAIAGEFDFVCFNVSPVFPPEFGPEEKMEFAKKINCGSPRKFEAWEIMPAVFEKKTLSASLFNKLYRADLCSSSLAALDNGCPSADNCFYISMLLLLNARSGLKIANSLSIWRVPHMRESQKGLYTLNAHEIRRFLPRMENAMGKSGTTFPYEKMRDSLLKSSVDEWLGEGGKDGSSMDFNTLAKTFGIIDLCECFIGNCRFRLKELADAFRHCQTPHCQTPQDPEKKIKSIGILYRVMYNGGAERVCWELAPALIEMGYSVTIFLEGAQKNDLRFKPPVKIAYLGGFGVNYEVSILQSLEIALMRNPVDLMMCHLCFDASLLWRLILLKYLGVRVMLFPHNGFYRPLLHPEWKLPLQAHAAILRLGDKVAALSRYDELYYRGRGIDAKYVPNPVRLPPEGWTPPSFASRGANLIVFCRLGEPVKNVDDCLRILAEVVREIPHAKMVFVGSFARNQGMDKFYQLARKLNVLPYIHVTGWVEDATPFVDSASVLVHTACAEGFPLSICEAQGRGVPAVMYDLPIEPARDNPAIIRVEQGDVQGAANEIIALLVDEARWRQLSGIAMLKMRAFTIHGYMKQIGSILADMNKKSDISHYSVEEYNTVIKTLGYYSANLPPWKT